MTDFTQPEIDLYIESLKKQVMSSRERISGDIKGLLQNNITIDKLFDILYDLFKSKDLLIEDQQKLDNNIFNKFVFTEEYPEQINTDGNIITFELTKRAPASLASGAPVFSGTKQYKPTYIYQEKDLENNGINIYYKHQYDNLVTFICWSTHAKAARELAALLESIITKYYPFFRTRLPVITIEGRSAPIFSNGYNGKRFRGIPIEIFIRTDEIEVIKVDELERMPPILFNGILKQAQ